MTKEQAAMEQHLEEKYRQEFIVEKPKNVHGGFGVDGIWVATAHPKNDKTLTFDLDADKSLTKIYDQYIAVVWSKEQTTAIQPVVEKIYGKDTRTKVGVKIVFSGDLAKDITSTSPTYEDAKKNYADRGFYYEYLIEARSDTDTHTEAERLYRLVEYARDTGVSQPGIHYTERTSGGTMRCILEASEIVNMSDSSKIEDCLNDKTKVEE